MLRRGESVLLVILLMSLLFLQILQFFLGMFLLIILKCIILFGSLCFFCLRRVFFFMNFLFQKIVKLRLVWSGVILFMFVLRSCFFLVLFLYRVYFVLSLRVFFVFSLVGFMLYFLLVLRMVFQMWRVFLGFFFFVWVWVVWVCIFEVDFKVVFFCVVVF